MEKRIASLLIIVENKTSVVELNQVISQFAEIIIGRIGLPLSSKKISLISLIIEGDPDDINSLAGKIGKLEGVKVKSMQV